MGKLVAAHSSNETSMITVPARYRKALPRSTRRIISDENLGQRYGGISRMKGASLLLSTVDFSKRAVSTAIRNPSRYKLSMATARVPRNGPSRGRFGRNAAITMVYTGSRAEHVMNGAIRMVAMRSRLLSMVRVAMIAGTAHAYAESSGMKLLPF